MPFREFRTLYPPHPAITWKPSELHSLRGYRAQYKYDDWHVLVYFFPNGKIRLYSRKKGPLPRYRPPSPLMQELGRLKLPPGEFHVLDGGLIHYRSDRVKNTIVLWDVLVHSSEYLLGTTYESRYRLLRKICGNPKKPVKLDRVPIALSIAPQLWLAPLLSDDPKRLFDEASAVPEIEGLVLKKMNAPLERAHRMESNARWQIRVRKPRMDYAF